jgi:hypothetical protein
MRPIDCAPDWSARHHAERDQLSPQGPIGLAWDRQHDRDDYDRAEQQQRLRRAIAELGGRPDHVDPDRDGDEQESGQAGRSRSGDRGEGDPILHGHVIVHVGADRSASQPDLAEADLSLER